MGRTIFWPVDAKGAAMIRVLLVLISFLALSAQAHIGSPDVFHDGLIGPYPARITIRMPNVVPGRAEISVRVETNEAVQVSFLPLYSSTAVKNAPPPDIGRMVEGENNLYAGELWLMGFGAYSVEVRIKGARGEGVAQIPVTSVAVRQLPMPSVLGKVLLFLAASLVVGGIGIAGAAGREAALLPGISPGKSEHRKGILAAASATVIFVLAVVGGRHWWNAEENDFRRHLREGAWPDLAADVRVEGDQRILRLEVGKQTFKSNYKPALIPDHGKLMHLFLVRQGSHDAFAHLHPILKERYTFEVVVPPLPEGRYVIYSDLTFEGGASSTASSSILLPSIPAAGESAQATLLRDADDSWASQLGETLPASGNDSPAYRLPDGTQVVWKSRKPLRANEDASLRFEVINAAGERAALEPYMGMLCHAVVLRGDGTVFAHLHPVGNFSMAAQSFFESKLDREASAGLGNNELVSKQEEHGIHHGHAGGAVSPVYLPYEFPEAGEYRIWVQFKTDDRVLTANFDVQVGE
jgi:hypothetical protein